MVEIDIFTFLTKGSADYAEFLKETCEENKSDDTIINWKAVKSVGSDRNPKGYNIVAEEKDYGQNSLNHSMAMLKATKYISSKYAIFADADIAILYKDWDKIVIKALNDYSCFGFSWGEDEGKYRYFPNVFFFCFNYEDIKDVNLDFTPKLTNSDKGSEISRVKVDNNMSKHVNIKVGDSIKCDTGWRLPIDIGSKGLSALSLDRINVNSKKALLPFADTRDKKECLKKPTHMSEWHYGDKVFGTHLQASRNMPFSGLEAKIWRKRIKLYKEQLGEKE